MKILSDEYIAGFVDGEGCFSLTLRRDVRHERRGAPTYYNWRISFVIVLRADDNQLLEAIKNRFNCGLISYSNNQVRYEIYNINDLKKTVIPFFKEHPLYGKKGNDFELWAKVIDILLKYKNKRNILAEKGRRGFTSVNWDPVDLQEVSALHQKMLLFKAKKSSSAKWINRPLGRERI